ncbi:hypothetical protein E8E14_008953 [Neopestalotiopsis sp. 37M]|nr:hypothetical protein E8E14_008953 [Neopestalotiopsis sp. 37M]
MPRPFHDRDLLTPEQQQKFDGFSDFYEELSDVHLKKVLESRRLSVDGDRDDWLERLYWQDLELINTSDAVPSYDFKYKRVMVCGIDDIAESVIDGLVSSPFSFNVTALIPWDLDQSPFLDSCQEKNIDIQRHDLSDNVTNITSYLWDFDIIIWAHLYSFPNSGFVKAAKRAGVERLVILGMAGPTTSKDVPRQVYRLFDVLDDIHAERVPYTIIHLGSIFDYFIPKVPSGKSEPNRTLTLCMDPSIGTQFVPGHEDQQIALLDYNDIGMYIAEIIADKRTFNRQVFAYSELSPDIPPMISTFYIRPGVQHSGFRIAPESHGSASDLQLLQNAMEIGESSGGNETQAVQYH